MKKVLIIGKNGFIAQNLYNWLISFKGDYKIKSITARNETWKNEDFSKYDVVINCSGLAHIKKILPKMEDNFYRINSELIFEIGKKAKSSGVKQIIHLSSMNVYGDFSLIINDKNKTNPEGCYGKSKLLGDQKLLSLEDPTFRVSIIRPPFVYGKNCPGNYNTVRKISKILPLFPNYNNKKSMIYIDNLCELIRLIIEDPLSKGIYTPQNRELVSTSTLIKTIAKSNNHPILMTRIFNPFIKILIPFIPILKKAFIDDSYTKKLSSHYQNRYNIVSFEDSIKKTESSSPNYLINK